MVEHIVCKLPLNATKRRGKETGDRLLIPLVCIDGACYDLSWSTIGTVLGLACQATASVLTEKNWRAFKSKFKVHYVSDPSAKSTSDHLKGFQVH